MTAALTVPVPASASMSPPSRDVELDDVRYTDVGPLLTQMVATTDDLARRRLRERIIVICMPLAENIARRFSGRGESHDDLCQVARVGLVAAVDRFDPSRGSDFLTFAVPTIMGEVRRHFRDNTWPVHVPRRVQEGSLRLRTVVDAMSHRLGRAPTVNEIAAETGLDFEDVTQAMIATASYRTDTLDAVREFSDQRDLTWDTDYEHVEAYLAAKPLLAQLSPREQAIISMRFFEELPQTQIAQRLGISQMHVSRLLASILTRLRTRADAEHDTDTDTGTSSQ